MRFIPAIEALRVANQNNGARLFYCWHLFSADGKPVTAGNGMTVPVRRRRSPTCPAFRR